MKHANIAVFVPHNGCPHTCAFCNQRTISGEQRQPTPEDVSRTLDQAAAQLGDRARSSELAFFGGSFTAIDREYMISLLEAAHPFIERGDIGGIRCSTRPDCIDDEVLDILDRYGVTAIELGAQSMDDRVLELNERGHTADDVRRASRMISERGFSLGLQMMTGLYGDSDEGAMHTARDIAALNPDTVRIYPTVVLRGTRLAELMEKGIFVPQDLSGAVDICSRLLPFFEERGIRVIRLGLHASTDIERDYVGGAYHPALRELCESRIFLDKLADLAKKEGQGELTVCVNPRDVSKVKGQHRCNITRLSEMGFDIKVVQSDGVPQGAIMTADRAAKECN